MLNCRDAIASKNHNDTKYNLKIQLQSCNLILILIMGNLCSICYPKRASNKRRPSSLYQETSGLHHIPSDPGSGPDNSPLSANVQCHVSRSCSQTQIPVTKSETFSLLGSHQGGGGSSTMKSEKRSLASKLSGTLNRANSESRSYSESKITALFEKYKNEEDDCILSEGIEEFCMDLQLKPDEFKVLVLAWQFGAEQMCKFTRQEFLHGCKTLKADSCKVLQSRLPDVAAQVAVDSDMFKDLYRFTFKVIIWTNFFLLYQGYFLQFGLDSSNGQRILPIEMAVSL